MIERRIGGLEGGLKEGLNEGLKGGLGEDWRKD
jgi:hypothetical protein